MPKAPARDLRWNTARRSVWAVRTSLDQRREPQVIMGTYYCLSVSGGQYKTLQSTKSKIRKLQTSIHLIKVLSFLKI